MQTSELIVQRRKWNPAKAECLPKAKTGLEPKAHFMSVFALPYYSG